MNQFIRPNSRGETALIAIFLVTMTKMNGFSPTGMTTIHERQETEDPAIGTDDVAQLSAVHPRKGEETPQFVMRSTDPPPQDRGRGETTIVQLTFDNLCVFLANQICCEPKYRSEVKIL